MAIKVAILGAGKMGNQHASVYKKLSNRVSLKYVVESDDSRREAFCAAFGCNGLRSLAELSPWDVDAIDICLPTYLHEKAIQESVKKSGYIFCEKPICLTESEFSTINTVVDQSNARLMVGQVIRFWNGYIKAKELLEKGAIGTLSSVIATRRQKRPEWSSSNWLMEIEKSGGLLFDLCIHDVDFICWLLGKPNYVSSQTIYNKKNIPQHSSIIMSYKNCIANIIGSWGMPSAYNNGELNTFLELVGDEGMITYRGSNELVLVTHSTTQTIPLVATNGYEVEIEYFISCIEKDEKPILSDLSAVKDTMQVLWAAEK